MTGVPAGTTVQSIAVDPDGFGLDVFPAGGSTPYLSYSSGTF